MRDALTPTEKAVFDHVMESMVDRLRGDGDTAIEGKHQVPCRCGSASSGYVQFHMTDMSQPRRTWFCASCMNQWTKVMRLWDKHKLDGIVNLLSMGDN